MCLNLRIVAFSLLTRNFKLIAACELLIRDLEFLTPEAELVTRKSKLLTPNFPFYLSLFDSYNLVFSLSLKLALHNKISH